MKHFLKLSFTIWLLLIQSPLKSQSTWVEIPLRLDKTLRITDSYLPYYRPKRPTIAIALSGGGARGFAQIGVLKTLESHGYPIDGISGTSMGAIIGGLFSVGYSATELESLAYQIRWDQIMRDSPPRKQLFLTQKEEKEKYVLQLRFKGLSLHIPSAYTAGQRLTTLITDLLLNAPHPPGSDFDNLHIPFRAVATDIIKGEIVVIKNGSLAEALRASMAIPLLFTPVRIGDNLLVDGGLVQNLPVTEASSFGTDLVIAVNTSSKLMDEKSLNAPWKIADQVTTIMQHNRTHTQMLSADISIVPELESISNTDFDQIERIIQAGELAAERAIPLIEKQLAEIRSEEDTSFHIKHINFVGCNNLDPASFLSDISINTDFPVSKTQIAWAGKSLLQGGYLKKVTAFVDTLTQTVIFIIKENPMITGINIIGNNALSDSSLMECISTKPNRVLNIQQGRQDIIRIRKRYQQEGFALSEIDTVFINNNGVLNIHINEGVIGKINLFGNNRTRPFVILRELQFKQGSLLNVSLLKQSIENIYSTGYFENVRFDIQKNNKNHTLNIHLTEHGYTLFRTCIRYDLERHTQGYVQLIEENMMGFGLRGSIKTLLGKHDELIQAQISSNRLFNTFITYEANLSIEKRHYGYYENLSNVGKFTKSISSASISIGQHMQRLGTLSLKLQTEKIDLIPTDGELTPREELKLVNITLCSEVDTRNRIPFPSRGKHHLLEYELAGRFIGSKTSYIKLLSSMESYYPLRNYLVFHPKICWGTSDMTTPFAKRFSIGGLDSFMGLPENALVGRRFIYFNFELRYRIPILNIIETYASIRYDLCGIWGRYSKIKSSDFKHGIGSVLSINTPFGPFSVGYGYMSDGKNMFYLSAGYNF
jgi:NTE family protein